MISHPRTVLVVTAVAVAGYCGAHRLGRWLDSPIVAVPEPIGTASEGDQDREPARSLPWQRVGAVDTSEE